MKKRNIIIGLGHEAKAGKDEVAKHLISTYNFQRIAFADTLKRACQEIFGFTDEQVFGDLKETIDPYWQQTPRYILQKVGTDCLRQGYDPDVWVKAIGKKIHNNPDTNWVITDCRFPNEADAIHKWGGVVVRVDRPQAGASGGISGHASETAMKTYKYWDYVINNNGESLENLYQKVDEFMLWVKKVS